MYRGLFHDVDELQTVSLAGSGIPLLIMALIAFGVPWLLVRRSSRSQVEVAVAVWASAGLALLAGAAVFGWVYADAGADVAGAFAEMPLVTVWFFLEPSLLAVIVWGPALALAWYLLAQRVEKRRGEDLMDAGGGEF